MSPKVFDCFKNLVSKHYSKGSKPGSVLELGTYHWSLLDLDTFDSSERIGVDRNFSNKTKESLSDRHKLIKGDINDLPFEDQRFDCIVSCSVFEHDKYFWHSIKEVNRVIKKGGLFVVGVPVYTTLITDFKNTTLTYHRHGISYNADFYRFSEQAVKEVFFDGFQIEDVVYVRRFPNPYLVVSGVKI